MSYYIGKKELIRLRNAAIKRGIDSHTLNTIDFLFYNFAHRHYLYSRNKIHKDKFSKEQRIKYYKRALNELVFCINFYFFYLYNNIELSNRIDVFRNQYGDIKKLKTEIKEI